MSANDKIVVTRSTLQCIANTVTQKINSVITGGGISEINNSLADISGILFNPALDAPVLKQSYNEDFSIFELRCGRILISSISDGIKYSDDRASTFLSSDILSSVEIYKFFETENGTVFAYDSGHLLVSNDSGESWASREVSNISEIIEIKGITLIACSTGIYRSNDGCNNNFDIVYSDGRCHNLVLLKNGSILMSNTLGIWKSTDIGLTWSLTNLTGHDVTFIQQIGTRLYTCICDIGGLKVSDNNGESWLVTSLSDKYTKRIWHVPNGAWYTLAGENTNDAYLYRSTNGGITWVKCVYRVPTSNDIIEEYAWENWEDDKYNMTFVKDDTYFAVYDTKLFMLNENNEFIIASASKLGSHPFVTLTNGTVIAVHKTNGFMYFKNSALNYKTAASDVDVIELMELVNGSVIYKANVQDSYNIYFCKNRFF